MSTLFCISIHAAREGGDSSTVIFTVCVLDFNPHRPGRRRRNSSLVCVLRDRISIHAAREGGDEEESAVLTDAEISIHAAREGGDFVSIIRAIKLRNFNPRRP